RNVRVRLSSYFRINGHLPDLRKVVHHPLTFKSVHSPALQLPASRSAIASIQTSSTNGFACKRRKAPRCNLLLFRSRCS
ncbi:hypothetical protein, partial [Pseudomonas syringae]|uniref:hypothetical protein n=1 Tax=Pseudomonas syringae TaxID=317 RepID=UPI001C3F4353